MRDQEDQARGRPEKNKERDTLMKGAIVGLMRNLAQWRSPRSHKDDPS